MTFPVQKEVGSVSHWSWRYLVVGEMRHKKLSQGLLKSNPSKQVVSGLTC